MRLRSGSAVASLAAAASLAAGCTCTCAGFAQGKEAADRAVSEFHERFNQGRFDAIWEASGDELKRATSQQDFTALLAAVRRKLGDVTGSTGRSWNIRSFNLTTYVQLQHETTFSTGKAVESFQFVVRDGRATLVGYHISSNDLIVR